MVQTYVCMISVDLIARNLRKERYDVSYIGGGRILNSSQGCRGKVDKEQQFLVRQKLHHLPELKRIACRAGVVSESANLCAGRVE